MSLPRTLAIFLTAATLMMTGIVLALLAFAGLSASDLMASYAAHNIVASAIAPIGLLLVLRVGDRHPIAWLLIVVGLSSALTAFGAAIALAAIAEAGARGVDLAAPVVEVLGPVPLAAAWLKLWAWVPGPVFLFTLLLVMFPDGRLDGTFARTVAGAAVGGTALLVVGIAAAVPETLRLVPATSFVDTNSIEYTGPAVPAIIVGAILVFGSAMCSAIAITRRYRRAAGVERLQLRWLASGGFVSVLALTVSFAWGFDVFNVIILLVIPVVPIAIGVAVLRYRLYDIDRVISRTIAYALVTAVLFAVFAGVNLALQASLGPFVQGNAIGVAVSTLVVAALFSPLRVRLQRTVDRRFDRARYDHDAALAGFAAGLRDEVDVDRVLEAMRDVATRSVQPTTVSVWQRDRRVAS